MNIDIHEGPVWQKLIWYLGLWKNETIWKQLKKIKHFLKQYISSL